MPSCGYRQQPEQHAGEQRAGAEQPHRAEGECGRQQSVLSEEDVDRDSGREHRKGCFRPGPLGSRDDRRAESRGSRTGPDRQRNRIGQAAEDRRDQQQTRLVGPVVERKSELK